MARRHTELGSCVGNKTLDTIKCRAAREGGGVAL
jgi:hypothetical protein